MLRWVLFVIVAILPSAVTLAVAVEPPPTIEKLEADWRAKLEATRLDPSRERDLCGSLRSYVFHSDGEADLEAISQTLDVISKPAYLSFVFELAAWCAQESFLHEDFSETRRIAREMTARIQDSPLGEDSNLLEIEIKLRSLSLQAALKLGLLEIAVTERPVLWKLFEQLKPDHEDQFSLLPELRTLYLLSLERYDELERVNREALLDSDSKILSKTRARLWFGLALVAMEREKIGQATSPSSIDLFQEGLREEGADPGTKVDLQKGLTISYWRLGDLDECRASLDSLEQAARTLPKRYASRSRSAMETVAALRFQVEQLSGTQSSKEAAHATLVELWEERFATWRSTPLRSFGRGLFLTESRRRLVESVLNATLGDDPSSTAILAALQILVDAQGCGTLTRRLDAPKLEIAPAWMQRFPEQSGILVYFPGAEESHLFAIDRSSITHHRLGSRDELVVDQDVFFRLVVLPPESTEGNAWREVSRRVAERLVPREVEERLNSWDQLTVIDSGVFEDVLFEYLILSDGEELGQRVALTHAPSLEVLELLRQRHRAMMTSPKILSVVASGVDSDESKKRGLAPLPLKMGWSKRLFPTYERAYVTELEGEAAQLGLFREHAEDHRIVQILCHGISDYTREDPAQLVWNPSDTRPDGLISSKDLAGCAFPPFALLTTCGGARAAPRRGDPNANDLPGAILEAGGSAVVASSAQLPTEETLKISAAIHRALSQGLSLAEAMRQVRIDRARRHPHPYDRGLLQVFGAGHLPVFGPDELDQVTRTRGIGTTPLVALIAIVMACGLYFRGRNRRRERADSSPRRLN